MFGEKYECDGQMSIYEFLDKEDSLRDKWPMESNEDIKAKDWHYVDEDLPTETDVYFCYRLCASGIRGLYDYCAWAKDRWWKWSHTLKKWMCAAGESKVVAWTTLPEKYRRNDVELREKLGMNGIV